VTIGSHAEHDDIERPEAIRIYILIERHEARRRGLGLIR
jgi:hypothetical protein